jgi:hypothetical protein
MLVIPAMLEAYVDGSPYEDGPKQKHETLPEKELKQRKGWGHMPSKWEALSSNPSTAKQTTNKRESSPHTGSDCTLILGFSASKTTRNKFILFKPSSQWYSVMATGTDSASQGHLHWSP